MNENENIDCFDVTKPVFLIKINTQMISRARVDEQISELKSHFQSKEANFWIITVKDDTPSNIECIWGGSTVNNAEYVNKIVDIPPDLNNLLIDSNQFTEEQLNEIKNLIRLYRINKIINDK